MHEKSKSGVDLSNEKKKHLHQNQDEPQSLVDNTDDKEGNFESSDKDSDEELDSSSSDDSLLDQDDESLRSLLSK